MRQGFTARNQSRQHFSLSPCIGRIGTIPQGIIIGLQSLLLADVGLCFGKNLSQTHQQWVTLHLFDGAACDDAPAAPAWWSQALQNTSASLDGLSVESVAVPVRSIADRLSSAPQLC